ncbi:hypothetical protein DMUE_0894 [Dictyocoela muelleri]|nr:hypothetical protein DMUE_0894 [Dictyocoela muelleri]
MAPDRFFINEKNMSCCKHCNVIVNSIKNNNKNQHLSTEMHKRNCSQESNSCLQTRLDFITETIKDSVFDGFLSANITLYKLRHPSLIKMFKNLNIKVPSVFSFRNCLT